MKKSAFATPTGISAFVLLLACPLLAQAPLTPVAQQPQQGKIMQEVPKDEKIMRQVSLVVIPVTVRDANGQMVDTLQAKDFQVTDNGVRQQIQHFEIGGDSLSLVFLVETSSRIEPLLPQIQRAAVVMAEAMMGPDDEAAVVGFNDSVDKLQDFTSSANAIEKTIAQLKLVTDGSKLYDAMAIAVQMLSLRSLPDPNKPGRRPVIVVMSEPTDVGSETKLSAVLERAQLSNITIYSVGLSTTLTELNLTPARPHPTPSGTFGRPSFSGALQTPETDAALYGTGNFFKIAERAVAYMKSKVGDLPPEVAATETGGGYFPAFKKHSIENAIDEIGGELHSQYSLSYTPLGTSDVGYHLIAVKVNNDRLKVRSRPGYYVAGPEKRPN